MHLSCHPDGVWNGVVRLAQHRMLNNLFCENRFPLGYIQQTNRQQRSMHQFRLVIVKSCCFPIMTGLRLEENTQLQLRTASHNINSK